MATVKTDDINPTVGTPDQPQGMMTPAPEVRYMPPTSDMANKGSFSLPSGNKVVNA